MSDRFAVLSFYAYYALFLLIEFVFTRSRLGSRERGDQDRWSILFFFIMPTVGIWLWICCVKTGWAKANPSWPLWIAGWAIGVLGFVIRIIAKRQLGRFLTVRVQLQEDHEVVDRGLYAAIRHPLYLGFIFEWMAPPLILGSPAGFLFTTMWIVIGVLHRIPREESLLVDGLGEKYRAYMGRTKRLIPGLW
jgi:protein-S-isoprenylcysteine O-methyltransferase Ste14